MSSCSTCRKTRATTCTTMKKKPRKCGPGWPGSTSCWRSRRTSSTTRPLLKTFDSATEGGAGPVPLRGRAHEASGLRERNEVFEPSPSPYASRVLDWKMHTMDRGPRSRPLSSTATPASMHQPLCGPGITPARGAEHCPATRRFLKARRAQPKHTPVENPAYAPCPNQRERGWSGQGAIGPLPRHG